MKKNATLLFILLLIKQPSAQNLEVEPTIPVASAAPGSKGTLFTFFDEIRNEFSIVIYKH